MESNVSVKNTKNQILDAYNDAATVADWNQLLSIKLALITSSNKDVVKNDNVFTFDDDRVTFIQNASLSASSDLSDKSLRRVFTSYAPFRN